MNFSISIFLGVVSKGQMGENYPRRKHSKTKPLCHAKLQRDKKEQCQQSPILITQLHRVNSWHIYCIALLCLFLSFGV